MKKLGVGLFGIGRGGHGVAHGCNTHPATKAALRSAESGQPVAPETV